MWSPVTSDSWPKCSIVTDFGTSKVLDLWQRNRSNSLTEFMVFGVKIDSNAEIFRCKQNTVSPRCRSGATFTSSPFSGEGMSFRASVVARGWVLLHRFGSTWYLIFCLYSDYAKGVSGSRGAVKLKFNTCSFVWVWWQGCWEKNLLVPSI